METDEQTTEKENVRDSCNLLSRIIFVRETAKTKSEFFAYLFLKNRDF